MLQNQKKEFLGNLDILAGHHDKEIYQKATPEKIQQIINDMGVVNEEGDKFNICSSIQRFKKFGPGVFLMFKLLKSLVIIFGILSVLIAVQFILLMKSPYYQGYENIVRLNMLRLTIASLQPQTHAIYVFFDFLITLVFLGWLIWWRESQERFVNQCNNVYKLPSYLTVAMKKIPEGYSEEKIKNMIEERKDIEIQEIYTARHFKDTLKKYKELTQLSNQFRLELELSEAELGEEGNKKRIKKMIKKLFELEDEYLKIKAEKFNTEKFTPQMVFIVFRKYCQREIALERFPNHPSCLKKDETVAAQQINLDPCQVQPDAINWENIGYPKWKYFLRFLLVFLLLSVLTCIGVIVIFTLEILETAAIGDAYYFSEKDKLKGGSSQEDHCLSMSPTSFLSSDNNCSEFMPDYVKLGVLIILAPFSIFVCKKFLMFILSHTVKFRKYSSQVSRMKSQIMILSFFYFIVAGVLHLVLYLKAKNNEQTLSLFEILYPLITGLFSLTNFNPASIHLYSDFSFQWYKQATFFIVIIGSTSFNISNCWKLILSAISHKLQIRKAKKQKNIYMVKKRLHGVHLHIEQVYSSAITITLFAFLYFTAIPIVLIFGLINLFILFWVCKYVFIKYSERLMRISHKVNTLVSYLLMGAIIVHCVMAPIYLGAPGIGVTPKMYTDDHYVHSNDSHQSEPTQSLTIGERYVKFGLYYITIMCLLFVYIIYRKILRRFILKMVHRMKNKKGNNTDEKDANISEFCGLYPSYSMHNNKKYNQILKVVYLLNRNEAKRETCKMDRNLKTMFVEQKSDYFKKSGMNSTFFYQNLPLFQKVTDLLQKQFQLKLYEPENALKNQDIPKEQIEELLHYYELYNQINIGSEPSSNQEYQVGDMLSCKSDVVIQNNDRGTNDRMMIHNINTERDQDVCEEIESNELPMASSGTKLNKK